MSDLRDLARRISDVAMAHPSYPQACRVVANCCDHLQLIAGFNETLMKLEAERRKHGGPMTPQLLMETVNEPDLGGPQKGSQRSSMRV